MEDFVIKEGVHFVGNPCIRCGNCIRYVKKKNCVLCHKDCHKQWLQNIKEENRDVGKFFEGRMCKECGGCIRYVSNNGCVLCKKELDRQRRENNPDYQKQWNQERKDKHEGLHYEGNPCKNCRNCLRYVSSGRCVLCKKELDKQRYQNIKETHKDKGLYFEGDPCKNCKNCIRYVCNGKCVLCDIERAKQYNQNNPDYQKEWTKNNPEKVKAKNQRRRALKQNAEGSFTAQEWIELCNYYGNKCIVPDCNNTDLEADHIIPLSQGGSNWITNIQPLCGSCNRSKGTKTIDYRLTTNLT